MKKRFLPIATAISAAALLAACSQTELIDDGSVKNNGTADNNAVTFSTYTAKKGGTRAGYEGNMTNATLKENGFGVFAYYTKDGKYTDARATATPNFMYNEEVTSTDGTTWTYSPLKYWPNDYASTNVGGGATGSGEHGNVSFFAYAPHLESEVSTGRVTKSAENNTWTDAPGTETGIVKMTSNNEQGDPKITYYLPSDVDLLWGTLNIDENTETPGTEGPAVGSGTNNNKGTTGGDNSSSFAGDVVTGKTVATDLNKQNVNGKVKFKFIHALAGIGGSTESVGGTEAEKKTKSGFKVILDIDNDGKASGGTRETFDVDEQKKETATTNGAYYRTIVTLSKVSITNNLNNKDGIEDGTTEGTEDERLYNSGILNLATGQWTGTTENTKNASGTKGNAEIGQNIDNDGTGSYKINTDIAEYISGKTSYFTTTDAATILSHFAKDGNTVNGIVETVAKNVYEDTNVPPILLIPGQAPKFRVNVVYVVRQYDEKLEKKYTEVVNDITKIVEFPSNLVMNTHYTLIMRLGLTGVKFYAQVADWTPGGDGKDDTPLPGEEPEGNGKDDVEIELPSNVVPVQNSGNE